MFNPIVVRMKPQTARFLNFAAVITGIAAGYLMASRKLAEPSGDAFRYRNEDLLRNAQAKGMADDYRQMERMGRIYVKNFANHPVGTA